ncbi:MAG: P-II family nitrogen regulator [Firmicutes bacterium]|nr:P-II family nitrogen regulator [Bacillota bacterium]
MKKVECIIRPSCLDQVRKALSDIGLRGMTVTQVLGSGNQRGTREYYRGRAHDPELLQKIKLEVVVEDVALDQVLKIILEKARTGEKGDGKIFITSVEQAIRIRTGESGMTAL